MKNSSKKIAVIGSGAWGTTIAKLVASNGYEVVIISQNQLVIDQINNMAENKTYLPGITLPKNIRASSEIKQADKADLVFIVVPSQSVREVVSNLDNAMEFVIASKGIEQDTLKLMSEVVKEHNPKANIAILSGPNLAMEIAQNKPAATTIAATNEYFANNVVELIASESFTSQISDDIITSQICGAAKNALAIASGILIGKDLGENAKAYLITKGIAEIARLCIAKGGKSEGLFSYSGIGDIFLTCNSVKSRNTSLGIELALGKSLEDIMRTRKNITEGVTSARSVVDLARKLKVSMPIFENINKVLYHNIDINLAVNNLLKIDD